MPRGSKKKGLSMLHGMNVWKLIARPHCLQTNMLRKHRCRGIQQVIFQRQNPCQMEPAYHPTTTRQTRQMTEWPNIRWSKEKVASQDITPSAQTGCITPQPVVPRTMIPRRMELHQSAPARKKPARYTRKERERERERKKGVGEMRV